MGGTHSQPIGRPCPGSGSGSGIGLDPGSGTGTGTGPGPSLSAGPGPGHDPGPVACSGAPLDSRTSLDLGLAPEPCASLGHSWPPPRPRP